jgi:hypothetical protein
MGDIEKELISQHYITDDFYMQKTGRGLFQIKDFCTVTFSVKLI